jgi:ubiquinone/menaquinone biosynthesis C-methylase UbiE
MTCAAGESAINFNDGDAYERFMGRWSRAAGFLFLEWLSPPPRARWLEVGCGTGAFTQLVDERCRPAEIVALDPAPAQIAYASHRLHETAVKFQVAAAEAIPSPPSRYDVVVSALALNFMTNRAGCLREMRRVARSGAIIAAYVWDFAGERAPHAPVLSALRSLGIDPPAPPGGKECALPALQLLFAGGDLVGVETRAFEIEVSFADFAAFWTSQTPSFSPTTRLIATLDEEHRTQLMEILRAELSPRANGGLAYQARANAVKARVP